MYVGLSKELLLYQPSSHKGKNHLFDIENAQILINLVFYVAYK